MARNESAIVNGKHLEQAAVVAVSRLTIPGKKCGVAQRRCDSQVAVQRNHAQRLYARRHAQHVGRRPEFAHEVSKAPHSQQDVAGAKWDHNQAHDEVGDGQRGDEEVGDSLEALEAQDGGDDQHVTWAQQNSRLISRKTLGTPVKWLATYRKL